MSNNLIVGYTQQDESREIAGHVLPVRRHPRGGSDLHVVRLRAVHAEQRAALQHASSCRTTSRCSAPKHSLTFGVQRRALRVGERLLPGLAERLRVQLAGRLLHRRQRLPRQSEPDDVAGDAAALPGPLEQHPRAGEPIQPLEVFYGGRLRAGRLARERQPEAHLGLRFDVPFFGDTGLRRTPTPMR